jgi:hypothetical protein
MEIPEMTITEIKPEPRNHEALQLLEAITTKVRENPDTTEIVALVKIGTEYHRFSTGVRNMMSLIATLEVAKHDCIRRMTED